MARQMALTEDHVARTLRPVADEGAPPAQLHSEAEYDDWVARILASHPAPDRTTRLFAYGSLIWRPEIPHVAEATATALGWHRTFSLKSPRFRGTRAQPGLMMVLEPGGQCRGVAYTLPAEDLPGQLGRLFRREFTYKPINSMPRWLTVTIDGTRQPALGFVMNRASPHYEGGLTPEAVADRLARACGHVGSGAEYLFNTVRHLEARGIHDRNLWRLQALVAARIDALHPLPR